MKERTESYAQKISHYLYSKTNEKEIIQQLLCEILKGRMEQNVLDVGCGPGLITNVLNSVAKNLTLVEPDRSYETQLRQKFPKAHLLMDSITNIVLNQQFDLILISQMLYYCPVAKWLPICASLFDLLSPHGLLIIVMNQDAGDWWKIVKTFKPKLQKNSRFFYQPWSTFQKKLKVLGPLQSIKYQYTVTYDSYLTLSEAIGKQVLQIDDEDILTKYKSLFLEFAQTTFKQTQNIIPLHVYGELTLISKELAS